MQKTKYLCALVLAIIAMFPGTVQAKEKVEVPEEVIAISEELGGRYNICPELIQAICWQESRFQADAENGGCVGIMQVYEKWHRDRMERLGVTNLYDMRQNMAVAADYLSELFKRHCAVEYVLDAYNGGGAMAERNYKNGIVSKYAESVLDLSEELESAHEK